MLRGITLDGEFDKWAKNSLNFGSELGAEASNKDFRKDIIIDVYNEDGQLVLGYKFYRCWVSIYQACPELDSNAHEVAIEIIKLENEGWDLAYEVTEAT